MLSVESTGLNMPVRIYRIPAVTNETHHTRHIRRLSSAGIASVVFTCDILMVANHWGFMRCNNEACSHPPSLTCAVFVIGYLSRSGELPPLDGGTLWTSWEWSLKRESWGSASEGDMRD